MGQSRELNPPYGVVNSIKIAELKQGGQEEPKCGRKNTCKMLCCECTGVRNLWMNGCEKV